MALKLFPCEKDVFTLHLFGFGRSLQTFWSITVYHAAILHILCLGFCYQAKHLLQGLIGLLECGRQKIHPITS